MTSVHTHFRLLYNIHAFKHCTALILKTYILHISLIDSYFISMLLYFCSIDFFSYCVCCGRYALYVTNEKNLRVCFVVRRALSSQQLTLASVMVVDAPGLRSPRHSAEERGANWSELCHNYLQERLQEHYHTHTFTHTLERYAQVTQSLRVQRLSDVNRNSHQQRFVPLNSFL